MKKLKTFFVSPESKKEADAAYRLWFPMTNKITEMPSTEKRERQKRKYSEGEFCLTAVF